MKRQAQHSLLTSSLSLLVAAGLAACSGGSSDSNIQTTTANLMVTSSGSSEVFSLQGELQEVRLVTGEGTRSENLITSPTQVEFVGQAGSSEWVARGELAAGSYETLEVSFDSASIESMDMAGGREPLAMTSGVRSFQLERPLELLAGASTQLVLHLDVAASMTSGQGGLPSFEPDFDIYPNDPTPVQEILGRLIRVDRNARTLVVEQKFEDRDRPVAFDVQLEDTTVLRDVDGNVFPSEASFYMSLLPGSTVLEIRGVMDENGVIVASRIRIRDYSGGGMDKVRIEGMVLHVDLAQELFVMLIRDVKEGQELATAALEAIGNPSSIDVHFDARTTFVLANGDRVLSADLRTGQMVDVIFRSFETPPFEAERVELAGANVTEVCFSAVITDASGLPERVIVRADSSCPLVRSGDIRSSKTDVTVELSGADIRLKMRDMPPLSPEQLSRDMKVELCGALSGDPSRPVLDASSVDVHPGHLIKGEAEQPNERAARFVVGSGKIVQPFGSEVTGFPADVLIARGARFLQDADDIEEFFEELEELEGGRADVKIKGIQSGTPAEILAFEIKLKIKKK